jgi:hypothetical protein
MHESTGLYLAAFILETLSPDMLDDDKRPNRLVYEPWPLPKSQEGRPLDGLVGDLPCSAALDLLREGVFFLGQLPVSPDPSVDLSPSKALPANNAVVMVTRSLAKAMGVAHPLVFTDEQAEDTVIAHLSPAPSLVVGRRIAAGPADPASRDALGRALLRLSTGGDALHRHASSDQLHAVLIALAQAADVEILVGEDFDWDFAGSVTEGLPGAEDLSDLHDVAVTFRDTVERFDPALLLTALGMAEDRAGAVCAGDPRPSLQRVFADGVDAARGRMLAGYLLSDDHLGLRIALGYHVEQMPMRTEALEEARA